MSGCFRSEQVFVSCHSGDHTGLKGKTLRIPYLWDDPDETLRQRVGPIIRDNVRPRPYIQSKENAFLTAICKAGRKSACT